MEATATSAIPATLDLFDAIARLKKERNAVVLAHYYQEDDIQDVADYIGDSLGLSQQAEKTGADMIVFAGVHFMGETAKILSPSKKVVMPDLKAGCSLAEACPADRLAAWKATHPDHYVIMYINCTAATKALSDIICTSSNAVRVVENAPKDRPILFGPDRHLGAWVQRQTGRSLDLWQGSCIVHEGFSLKKLIEMKAQYPGAKVIAHPECEEAVLAESDYIGSTTALLNYAKGSDARQFIVATEPGILHQMRKAAPEKEYLPLPGQEESCACNECPYMRLNTLEKLYLCMLNGHPEITVPEEIRRKALIPIQRMLALG